MAAPDDDFPLLYRIDSPSDLRQLAVSELPALADELRRFLIQSVSRTGGHLAAGLGVVELTIALHYVLSTPEDRLIWDVGHQAYPHKILTGRRDRMGSLRQRNGISGFLRRDESPYDAFGAGHSSTSISAALGMAVAAAKQDSGRQVAAVIGDGALTAGMAFEALNHAGDLDVDMLVVLNDNDMSISPNVGAVNRYLARVLSSKLYISVREGGKSALRSMPAVSDLVRRWEEHMKGMIMPGTLFEEMGFTYIGPVDGHDIPTLITTLSNMRAISGPRLLHVVTQKGRGYEPAEGDPCVYHGVTPFNPSTGKMDKRAGGPTYTQVFSDWLCDAAERDDQLVAITPAMCEGSGMVEYSRRYPDRYFDVGIAEQHALTFAAGLACEGLKPVVAIYSTFLQRAYDQLVHDIVLQDLDVTLAVDRAGLVGADGPTHAGSFDLSFARCAPNLLIMAPADENECRQMLQTAYEHRGPAMVRYPRGSGPGVQAAGGFDTLPVGRGLVCREGKRVALLAFGSMLAPALEVGEALNASVVNMRFIKPMDAALVRRMAQTHDLLVTLEENAVQGGAGSAVNECLADGESRVPVLNLGLPDRFVEQGTPAEQLEACGLSASAIKASVLAVLTDRGQSVVRSA